MINTTTKAPADTDYHRLTINDLRNFENLSEEVMFDLTNEEFENMMNQMDSSACIEPLYFPSLTTELEPQSLCYY